MDLGKWVGYNKEVKKQKELRRGFDWAAGVLLKEEETPISIESYCNSIDRGFFDMGAEEAVNLLIKLGIIIDDRV